MIILKKKEKEVIFYEFSDFKYHLQIDKRLSENTVKSYITDLELYGEFLNLRNISVNNDRNFDKYREAIKDGVENLGEKVSDFVDDLQEKVDDIKDEIADKIEDANLDDKFNDIKDKVSEVTDKVVEKAKDIKEDIETKVDKVSSDIKKKDTSKKKVNKKGDK